jgi:filamentous hemagglutinin
VAVPGAALKIAADDANVRGEYFQAFGLYLASYTEAAISAATAGGFAVAAGGVRMVGAAARASSSGARVLPFPTSATRFFARDEAVAHFASHGSSIQRALGAKTYNLHNYLEDANHVVQNGTYVPELHGFVQFIGASGRGNYAFVGLNRSTGNITTFHIKGVEELSVKAPSLGLVP